MREVNPFFSIDREPLAAGTFSNLPDPAPLTMAKLKETIEHVRKLAGAPLVLAPHTRIVSPSFYSVLVIEEMSRDYRSRAMNFERLHYVHRRAKLRGVPMVWPTSIRELWQ